MSEPGQRTALYRIRGEAEVLLYIGITNSPAIRWNGHQLIQPWWDELRTLTVEWYDSRTEAEAAEKAAVLAEQPKYNVTYLKPTGPARERKPLGAIPVQHGKAELEPRVDDENRLTFDAVGNLLSVKEVATRLRLSEVTIRRLIKSGDLEGVHVGARVLVAPEAVADYKARLRATAHAGDAA